MQHNMSSGTHFASHEIYIDKTHKTSLAYIFLKKNI